METEQAIRVLIVEDSVLVGEMVRRLLEREGYEIAAITPSGLEAITQAQSLRPDVILMDIELPDINGLEVVRRIQALCPTPVVVLTAYDTPELVQRASAVGVGAYLVKPPRVRDLERAIAITRARFEDMMALQHLNVALRSEVMARQQTELALRASEKKYRYVLEQTEDGCLIVNAHDQIVYANAQARLCLGLTQSPDEALPLTTFKALAEKCYRCEPQAAWSAWPEGTLPLYLVRPETPGSHALWLQVRVFNAPAGAGEDIERIIHLKDVTERTSLQHELTRFHMAISHKLRTPLVPMYGNLQFLAEYAPTAPPEEVALLARDAFAGVKRLRSEIEDILHYLDAPTAARPGEVCSLATVASIAAQAGAELGLSCIEIKGQKEDDIYVNLSRHSLELIMWEILENARKFHPTQSPCVEVVLSCPAPDQAKIQIGDDGLTLDPGQLVRMWSPYYQSEKFSTGQVEGMGLGLSLVAAHVWSASGTCRAYNRPDGPGVVIELMLPIGKEIG